MRRPVIDQSIEKYTGSYLIKSSNLFIVRIVLTLWIFGVLLMTFSIRATRKYPFTFTYLSFNGIFLYLVSSIYISLMERNEKYTSEVPTIAGWINSVLYQCAYCYHLIVPLVYWILLAPDEFGNQDDLGKTLSVFVHALDFVVLTIEFILNRQQTTYFTVFLYIVVTVLYMFWTWIFYSFSNQWIVTGY